MLHILGGLLIAGCTAITATPEPQPTATLVPYLPALPTGTTVLVTPSPFPVPTIGPAPTPFTHVVQKDETLSGIALRYGVELEALLAANPGVDPRALSIGQKLIIPGPEGAWSQGFFPTPTPVPMIVSQVRCFSDGLKGAWCLLSVQAAAGQPVEAVAVVLSAFDAQGRLLASEVAYSALYFIPVGQAVPMAVRFQVPAADIAQTQAQVVRAFAVEGPEARFAPIEVVLSVSERDPTGKAWALAGTLTAEGELTQGASRLVLLATALDEGGDIVGYAVWQHDGEIRAGETIEFSTHVFSLGAPIEDVELIAQGLRLPS